jgi:hypothetical protein
VAFLFVGDYVQKIYGLIWPIWWHHESMARSGISSKASLKRPGVKLSIETRPSTSAQLEAGKRLFSRLLARAQSGNKE